MDQPCPASVPVRGPFKTQAGLSFLLCCNLLDSLWIGANVYKKPNVVDPRTRFD